MLTLTTVFENGTWTICIRAEPLFCILHTIIPTNKSFDSKMFENSFHQSLYQCTLGQVSQNILFKCSVMFHKKVVLTE